MIARMTPGLLQAQLLAAGAPASRLRSMRPWVWERLVAESATPWTARRAWWILATLEDGGGAPDGDDVDQALAAADTETGRAS